MGFDNNNPIMACSFVQRSGSIEPEYAGFASREIKNIVYVLRSIYPRHLGGICGLSARSLCDQRAYKIISSNHRNSKTFNILIIFRINIHHWWYHKKYQQMSSPLSATPDYIANITQPRQRVKNDMGFFFLSYVYFVVRPMPTREDFHEGQTSI